MTMGRFTSFLRKRLARAISADASIKESDAEVQVSSTACGARASPGERCRKQSLR